MFDLSPSHSLQLLLALSGGIIVFVTSITGHQRQLFKALIIVIPFQFIDSKYGSINMALTYTLGASMIINRSWVKIDIKRNWPLFIPFLIILLAYSLSFITAPKMFQIKNIFFFIFFGSNIIIFYMSYHFTSDEEDFHSFFKLLIICNILVIIYCSIQLVIGFGEFGLFGIDEFKFQHNRSDKRLVGPFNAAGITAEYLVIQCLIIAYYILTTNKYRIGLFLLIFCNIATLVGTGNRGGFISFCIGFFLFFVFFRKRLGTFKVTILGGVVIIIMASASFVMVKYTDFNTLFIRMLGTTIDGGIPDTRRGWPNVVEESFKKPILGHGPRLIAGTEPDAPISWPKGHIDYYPHNLYLFVFYTAGIIGLFAWCIWAFSFLITILREKHRLQNSKDFIAGLPNLAIIIFSVVIIDQMKVEALRWYLLDFQHYLFALFGLFCSLIKPKFNNTQPNY